MPGKLTAKQLGLMCNRRALLNDRLQYLNDLITGRSTALADFIIGKDGRVSEEKVSSLTDELIGCLKRRRRLEKQRALGKKTEEMYRAFLYLAITGLIYKRNRRVFNSGVFMQTESFADVVRFAELLEPSGLEDHHGFLMAELECFVTRYCTDCDISPVISVQGTFEILLYVMRDCLEHFTLYSLSRGEQTRLCEEYAQMRSLSEGEKEKLTDSVLYEIYDYEQDLEYSDKQAAEEEAKQMAEYERQVSAGEFTGTFEEYESAQLDLTVLITDEDIEALYPEDDDSDSAVGWRSWETADAWADSLTDPKHYCGSFDTFVTLYFGSDRSALLSDVTDMIDTFLFEQGLSAFSFGDDYLMINHHFDKFKDRVEAEIGRGRGK